MDAIHNIRQSPSRKLLSLSEMINYKIIEIMYPSKRTKNCGKCKVLKSCRPSISPPETAITLCSLPQISYIKLRHNIKIPLQQLNNHIYGHCLQSTKVSSRKAHRTLLTLAKASESDYAIFLQGQIISPEKKMINQRAPFSRSRNSHCVQFLQKK